MYAKLLKDIQKKAYFDHHKKVLIAVSGGVDSMNLLHFLYLYRENLDIEIGIAHINHKQRPESEMEEDFLRHFAQEHGLPIHVSNFSGIFSEKAARDFRYDFFKQVMQDYNYTALVTAHHADDQAETVFMRLLRGSRLRHLRGIKSVQNFGNGQLIRPFLSLSKSELPDIFHFEDSSNASPHYLRNRIRNSYFPMLEEENPQFKLALNHLAYESQLVFQAFQDLTVGIDVTNCQTFLKQSSAVQELLLQNYLENFPDLHLSREQFQEMLNFVRTKDSLNYPIKNGYFLKKTAEVFSVEKISPKTYREKTEKVLEYDNIVKYGQYRFSFHKLSKVFQEIFIENTAPILLRQRKAGDKIDFGSFSKKLRRLFIDNKISTQARQEAIVGEQDGKIIFVLVDGKTYLRKASKDGIMKAKLYIEKIE